MGDRSERGRSAPGRHDRAGQRGRPRRRRRRGLGRPAGSRGGSNHSSKIEDSPLRRDVDGRPARQRAGGGGCATAGSIPSGYLRRVRPRATVVASCDSFDLRNAEPAEALRRKLVSTLGEQPLDSRHPSLSQAALLFEPRPSPRSFPSAATGGRGRAVGSRGGYVLPLRGGQRRPHSGIVGGLRLVGDDKPGRQVVSRLTRVLVHEKRRAIQFCSPRPGSARCVQAEHLSSR